MRVGDGLAGADLLSWTHDGYNPRSFQRVNLILVENAAKNRLGIIPANFEGRLSMFGSWRTMVHFERA